jgi:4-hydroxybenzoate polyprenyltransferase
MKSHYRRTTQQSHPFFAEESCNLLVKRMQLIIIMLTAEKQKYFLLFLNFIHTLELFTDADILTFVLPTSLFAVFGAVSGTTLSTNASLNLFTILSRVPSILLLVWSNLLIFNIANQRLPDAILEDVLNKPSRPLPSGRISPLQARRLLLITLPIVLALSFYLGPWQETLLLFALNWMYNDLKGCDEDFVTHNLLIAIAYGLYNSAALRIACGVDSSITTLGVYWIIIVSCIIFTTTHIGDLKDQAGDKTRGRRSAPLVLGDGVSRWTIAVPVIVWSIACPFFLGVGYWGYLIPVTVGCVVSARTLLLRCSDDDTLTWKIWAMWTMVLFSLPLVKEHAVLRRSLEYIVDRLNIGSNCSKSLDLVAVSSIAMLIQSRRLCSHVFGAGFDRNETLI